MFEQLLRFVAVTNPAPYYAIRLAAHMLSLVKGLALLAMYPFLVMMVMMLRYNNIFYRMFYSECDDDLTYLITSQFGSDYTLHSFGFLGLIKLYIADNEKEYHCFNCLKSVKILAE